MTDTIRDRLKKRITLSTLMIIPAPLALVTAIVLGWIKIKPEFVVTFAGGAVLAGFVAYMAWWMRLSRFPCPKCGVDLWTKTQIPHECPYCGFSLDSPSPGA